MADFDFTNLTIQECIEAKALLDDRLEKLGEGKSYKSLEQKAMVLRQVKDNFASFLAQYGITLTSDKVSSEWVEKFKGVINQLLIYSNTLTEFTFEENVELKSYAFANLTKLENLIIPNVKFSSSTMEPRGHSIAIGCSKLKTIDISNVSEMGFRGMDNNPTPNNLRGFIENPNFTTVILNPNLNYIGRLFFANCSKLENLQNLNNVETVGDYAFYGTNIKKVTKDNFPNLKEIGLAAFNVTAIEEVDTEATIIGGGAFTSCAKLKKITVNGFTDGYKKWYGDTYWASFCDSCSALEEFNSNTITLLAKGMFANCTNLKKIRLDTVVSVSATTNGYWDICSYCTNLKGVYLKNLTSVLYIGRGFQYCSNLKLVMLPNLTTAGYKSNSDCFTYCYELEKIILPKLEGTLGGNFVRNCTKLRVVAVPMNKKTFAGNTFRDCSALEIVDIGFYPSATTVLSLYTQFLGSYTNLKHFIIRQTDGVVAMHGQQSYASSCIYYVPDELVESYKVATNWSSIPDRIKGLSEIPAEVLAELVPPTEADWLALEEEIASEQTS